MGEDYSSAELRELASALLAAAAKASPPQFLAICTEDGTGEGTNVLPSLMLASWIDQWGGGLHTVKKNLGFAATELRKLADDVDRLSDAVADGFSP